MSNFLNNLIQPAVYQVCSKTNFYKWCSEDARCATNGFVATFGQYIDSQYAGATCGEKQLCNCGCTK